MPSKLSIHYIMCFKKFYINIRKYLTQMFIQDINYEFNGHIKNSVC